MAKVLKAIPLLLALVLLASVPAAISAKTENSSGALRTTVGQVAPSVSAATTPGAQVRLNSPVSVKVTFSEPVSGFTLSDISVVNGAASGFSGSGDVYTFDVKPNALDVVTVDIAAGVATDGEGNPNTAAPQLSLGIPYDFDGNGGISRAETIAAIRDYFGDNITRAQAIAVIRLYFSTPTEPGPGTGEGDRANLVALYNATGGPNWANNTGWLSNAPMGQWYGVTTGDNGRVTGLDLYENQLSGEIPPELGNLSNLGSLELHYNDLSGEIPPELENLANLERLSLDGNQLSGEIPPWLGNLANLKGLNLSWNQLSGEIPPELENLANLERLSLDGNQLSGEIPPWLGNLANLKGLNLAKNQLSGEIPPELGNLANLTQLSLYENQLSGEIPPELGKLANMAWLDLSGNQLSGDTAGVGQTRQLGGPRQKPAERGDTAGVGQLANLEHLDLAKNQLSGEIPPELGKLANLEHLDLAKNQLSGEIPPELGNLANLEHLDLGGNPLSGCVPSSLSGRLNMDFSNLGGLPFCP